MPPRKLVGFIPENQWAQARAERVRQRQRYGVPICTYDTRCQNLGDYVRHAATVACEKCGSMVCQNLEPADLNRHKSREVTSCNACQQSTYVVPSPDAIPLPLRGLSPAIVYALRPCGLHQGDLLRTSQTGYHYYTEVSCISWSETTVQQKVAALPDDLRSKAQAALRYLNTNEGSWPYQEYLQRHQRWLNQRERSPRFWRKADIKEPYLECALWPHLYHCAAWADNPSRDEGDGSDSDEGDQNLRRSAKRSFAFKVLSPVLDYSVEFSLATFVYDRWFLATFTGAGYSSGCTLHRAVAKKALGNAYPVRLKQGMCDFHRIYGWADYFLTIAPF